MLHSNIGEVHQLLSTFNRVWGAGGEASLSLKTVDGKVSAVLEVQLRPPTFPRSGAPGARQQAAGGTYQQSGQRRRRRRGPGRQARDAARQEAWRKRRLESQLPRHSPPPPTVETTSDNIALSPVKTPEKENKPGHPVKKSFKCEHSDFSSDTKRGLNVHKGKAHRPEPESGASQLEKCDYLTDLCDGRNDSCYHCEEEKYYRENLTEVTIIFNGLVTALLKNVNNDLHLHARSIT